MKNNELSDPKDPKTFKDRESLTPEGDEEFFGEGGDAKNKEQVISSEADYVKDEDDAKPFEEDQDIEDFDDDLESGDESESLF